MRVLLTGGAGMLGRALSRAASGRDGLNLVAVSRSDCDLTDREAVASLLRSRSFDLVIHSAARVGGIKANIENPYVFLQDNLVINSNVIDESYRAGIKNFLFVGSSCMYPKDYANPLREEHILQAPLEPTNEGYAISKIAGAKACEYLSREHGLAYRTILPCNLYGPGDTYDLERSHLLSAIVVKTEAAVAQDLPEIEIWGDGKARREFLFVDDLARFMLDLLPSLADLPPLLNIGAMEDHSVDDYYYAVANVLGYRGDFRYDLSRPVGMRHKLIDSSKAAAFGWRPTTTLDAGIALTVADYRKSRT